jgi:hypothetical protein
MASKNSKSDKNEDVFSVLSKDFDELSALLKKDSSNECLRRCYVRAYFAMVEASCSEMRRILASEFHTNPGIFSPIEQMVIREKIVKLDHGKAFEEPSRFRTQELILFTMRMVARFAEEPEIEHISKEWAGFKDALKMRDGFMHPKTMDDVKISDKEYHLFLKASAWYLKKYQFYLSELLKYAKVYDDDKSKKSSPIPN